MKYLRELVSDENGQCLVESALLISFTMLATVAVAAGCRNSIAGIANTVSSNLATGERFTNAAIERAAPKIEKSVMTDASSNKNFNRKVIARNTNRTIQRGFDATSGMGVSIIGVLR